MATRPQNLLFIWTDQQRPDTIGAYGNPQIRTPHLDRLATEGILFQQAYCAQPVCAPARATALTGLYPHTHGVLTNGIPLDPAVPAIAELLAPAGLFSGHIGCWHLAPSGHILQPQRGFEQFWVTTEDQYTREHATEGYSSYYHFLVSQGYAPADSHRDGTFFARTTTTRLPEAVTKPAFQATEAIRFLETYGDQPFLLVVGIHEPHPPFFGPFDDLYQPEEMALPESWYAEMDPTAAGHARHLHQAYRGAAADRAVHTNDERGWKELKVRYWGLCTLVDRQVGRVLTRLDELGLAESTIVVFTADHGHLMGEHRLLHKGVQYEPAVQIPLIIKVPGLRPRRIATPVGHVSLMPTLLELLGQPVPAHIQGISLAPLLHDGDSAPDEAEVLIEWNGPWGSDVYSDVAVRTIRRGRWKLNLATNGDHELYDLHDDPAEMRNAISDPGRQAVVSTLFERLRTWQHQTHDPVVLPDPTAG